MIWSFLALVTINEIKQMDWSADRQRQITVDREAGQYLGHVSTVLLDDQKTILCVYPKGHGRGAIILKRSKDGGKTWSERLPVPENWATSLETPTIHLVTNPKTGKRRLLLWSGLHPARIATSEDLGSTWSPLRSVGEWGGIVVMGSLAQLANGKLIAWFHDDGRFFNAQGKVSPLFTMFQTESTDGGDTWSSPRAIWKGSDVHLCEPGVITSPGGSQMALLLRENRRKKQSHVILSRDHGDSWGAPYELNSALTGDRHTLKYAQDGRVVCVFRDMSEGAWKGDFVAWVGTYEDIVKGRRGQFRIRLLDNQNSWDCGYPGLELLPDGTFVATTYGYWDTGEPPYIKSVRFKLSELK